jgi:hypothetical protein
MPMTPVRRLTLADLVILVAGSAAALVMWRFSRETNALDWEPSPPWNRTLSDEIVVWSEPALISLAASLLVSRLIPPRPRWRACFRQPGTWASLAILSQLLYLVLAVSWHPRLRTAFVTVYLWNFNQYLYANRVAGGWVAVAWATLALSRSWRAEPSWIDRTGRILGVCAIVLWVASALIW